jgi:hypothetical protein
MNVVSLLMMDSWFEVFLKGVSNKYLHFLPAETRGRLGRTQWSGRNGHEMTTLMKRLRSLMRGAPCGLRHRDRLLSVIGQFTSDGDGQSRFDT